MCYADYEFSVYFLKFYHAFSSPNLVPQSGTLQIDCAVTWYSDICDYGFEVYFFTLLAIPFFRQIWSQNLAKIVSKDCYTCCMPNF